MSLRFLAALGDQSQHMNLRRWTHLPGCLPLSGSSKGYGEPTARLALTLSSHCPQVFATEGLRLTQERGVWGLHCALPLGVSQR